MQNITLYLTLDEANLVLQALGAQPYTNVFSLIAKVQKQAQGQLQPQDAAINPEQTEGT